MYNVAPYVERCIRSLQNQDIPKYSYEIICINDGSPDNCREVVENLQKEFSNIILINQENQGVSMARNNAIAIAKGNYILPIDPDDYVVPNTFKNSLVLAEEQQLDILYLSFEIFDEEGKSVWITDYSKQKERVFNGIEGYFAARGFDIRDPDRSWAILYRSDLLRQFDIKYPKDVPYLEDGLFLAKVFSVANKVMFDDTTFYQRTTRKGSATNSRLFHSEKAIDGFIRAIHDIKEFSLNNKLEKKSCLLVNHVVAKFVILSLSPSIASFNLKNYYKVISKLKNVNLTLLDTEGLQFLYKRHIRIFNFSKLLFPFYFRLFNK